jgi:diguanylate cyclase (GGDEF)-like protein
MNTAIPSRVERYEDEIHRLPPAPMVYLTVVAAAAVAAALPAFAGFQTGRHDWRDFVIFTIAAAIAQVFKVETTRNQSMHAALVFAIPAALLLPPGLVVLLAITIHIPEWLKERYEWFIQTFNISNWLLSALAAWGAAHIILHSGLIHDSGGRYALAGFAATLIFVLLNHLLLAIMLKLGRGHSFRESGLFKFEALSTDLVITALGTAVAILWLLDPWVAPAALAPLLLIHRSLSVPALQAEARVDPKTGLFNARHFAAALRDELGRAIRFERPMALLMADLDLLRDINNTYGHLAGDAVLAGVAKVFREQLREYDVPARFGGEEFSILLPETTPDKAAEIAERIRRAVAATDFDVSTSSEPIRATISLGIASYLC